MWLAGRLPGPRRHRQQQGAGYLRMTVSLVSSSLVAQLHSDVCGPLSYELWGLIDPFVCLQPAGILRPLPLPRPYTVVAGRGSGRCRL